MKIAICTKGRPENQITLKLIYKIFKPEEIFLFVEPQELEQYKKYQKISNIVSIGQNNKGLAFSRNFVTKNLSGVVFILDDDITGFQKRTKRVKGYWRLSKMDLRETLVMFRRVEAFLLDNKEYAQATISYSKSNWLFEGDTKTNTRAWCIKANNNDILKKNNLFITNFGEFEDYDQTLEILRAGFKNISFYNWAFNCVNMGTNDGGCQTFRRKEGLNRKEVDQMKEKWGDEIVKEFYSKQHGLPEIKVFWKRAISCFNN